MLPGVIGLRSHHIDSLLAIIARNPHENAEELGHRWACSLRRNYPIYRLDKPLNFEETRTALIDAFCAVLNASYYDVGEPRSGDIICWACVRNGSCTGTCDIHFNRGILVVLLDPDPDVDAHLLNCMV